MSVGLCAYLLQSHDPYYELYILHNLSHTIYIFPALYSWMFPIRLMNTYVNIKS